MSASKTPPSSADVPTSAETAAAKFRFGQWMSGLTIFAILLGLTLSSIKWSRYGVIPTASMKGSETEQPAEPEFRPSEPPPIEPRVIQGMVYLTGGSYRRGNPLSPQPDQRRARVIEISSFWLDQTLVTNRQFGAFIAATNYQTTAEQTGFSQAFIRESGRWETREHANWRQPSGVGSSIAGREDYPIVQVSWFDAVAYANWADKRLPTEAEWEFAARGGLIDTVYPWGRDETPDSRYHANYWQGWFPSDDRGLDGFRDLSPVKSFPTNRFGLYDMAGNAWEWCSDWNARDAYERSESRDPRGPNSGSQRVRRGGSWLSAQNNNDDIRVDSRRAAPPEMATNAQGFRCARSAKAQ